MSILSYFRECTVLIAFVGPVSSVCFDPPMGFSAGDSVTCKADGYPRPTFHWIRTSDNFMVAEGAKLSVKSANDSYVCIATNTVRGHTYTAVSTALYFAAAAAAAGISHIIDFD